MVGRGLKRTIYVSNYAIHSFLYAEFKGDPLVEFRLRKMLEECKLKLDTYFANPVYREGSEVKDFTSFDLSLCVAGGEDLGSFNELLDRHKSLSIRLSNRDYRHVIYFYISDKDYLCSDAFGSYEEAKSFYESHF